MSVIKVILIGCAVLIINNLVLLNFMGYFSDEYKIKPNELSRQQTKAIDTRKVEQDFLPSVDRNPESEIDLVKQAPITSSDETRMIDMLRNVAETDEFIAILDDYQNKAGHRYSELGKKYGAMDAVELYDVVQNAETNYERQFALQIRTQSKFGELQTYQLKNILNSEGIQNWHKGKILSNLLERQDSDALSLAKDYMATNSVSRYLDQDLVRNVYDLDPQYIKELVINLDLDKGNDSFSVLSVALEDSKIAKQFYAKNFDKIIESNNSELFNYLNPPMGLDLTAGQQNRVVELMKSPNRHKRRFAMGMLGSVENLDTLRDVFLNIRQENDKRNFIYSLVGRKDDPERTQLGKELSEAIDDPRLQKYLISQ